MTGRALRANWPCPCYRHRSALDKPQIEIQRHDIAIDPLPEQLFDLIHAQLVLFHVPTREKALFLQSVHIVGHLQGLLERHW